MKLKILKKIDSEFIDLKIGKSFFSKNMKENTIKIWKDLLFIFTF